MIKLLRNIRQRMIKENKISKYLLYAMGEIVLVVIGILIALQINNWNDELKQRNLEIKILKEISGNLKLDLVEIRQDISIMDSVNLAGHDILQFMKKEAIPSELFYYDVSKLRVNPHFDPNKSGYSLLVSKGVEIIENDSLRGAISVLYESAYPYYYRYEEERTQFKVHQINPVLLAYFNWLPSTNRFFPGLYEISISEYINIKNDQTFIRIVNAVVHENALVQNRAQRIESSIVKVMGQLQNELRLKKSR
ncbi:MAG: hypothetical protein E4H26_11090 [Flavobacteriales bacterium]|nr:MAG: hypothetical protein E4H26_11090 [Flavobacteriales bacterium]